MTDPHDLLSFNGIDARTGGYLLELGQSDLIQVAKGQTLDKKDPVYRELNAKYQAASEAHYGVKEGADPKKLEESGWAVIFPAAKPPVPKRSAMRPSARRWRPFWSYAVARRLRSTNIFIRSIAVRMATGRGSRRAIF